MTSSNNIVAVFELPMSLGMFRYGIELTRRLENVDVCFIYNDVTLGKSYFVKVLRSFLKKAVERKGIITIKPVPLPVLSRKLNSAIPIPMKIVTKLAKYSVVHSFNYLNPEGIKWATLSCKKIITVYDLIPLRLSKLYGGQRIVEKVKKLGHTVWKKCDAILTISESSRNDIVRCFGIPRDRIKVIYPAVDRSFFKPVQKSLARRKLGIPESEFIVLYVGSAEPKRALPLKALIHGVKDLPVKVILAGPFKHIKERSANKITIIRNPPDTMLPPLYSACDVFVFPTLAEGFGIPVLEAMSCGAPVIVPRNTSLPEVVGDAGIYVEDPLNPEEWRTAVRTLLEDPGLRKRLSKKALARAKEFSWESSAWQLRALYEELSRR